MFSGAKAVRFHLTARRASINQVVTRRWKKGTRIGNALVKESLDHRGFSRVVDSDGMCVWQHAKQFPARGERMVFIPFPFLP